MSFVANIAFARPRQPPEYKRFGAIWYDKDRHRCSLLLDGIHMGQFFGKPHTQSNAPYLKGDILVAVRQHETGGLPKTEYLWCGWVWTESNQDGAVYNGVLEVDPTPAMLGSVVARVLAEWRDAVEKKEKYDPTIKTGFFLNIELEDKL